MSKGDDTRERILRKTGALFNRFGYGSTPVSAVMEATGLQKGGLYGHFRSKEELAIEALRFNLSTMASFVRDSQKGITDPVEGLHRLISCSLEVASGNVVVGGCPVLNAAIESDDAFPALRVVAAEGAEWLRRRIRLLLLRASKRGRLRAGADIDTLSHFFLASIEGGIMLARLHGKASPLAAVVRTLHGAIDALSIDSTKSATAGNLD